MLLSSPIFHTEKVQFFETFGGNELCIYLADGLVLSLRKEQIEEESKYESWTRSQGQNTVAPDEKIQLEEEERDQHGRSQ